MSLNTLIVDDSALMRSMVQRALAIGGVPLAEVHTAQNGRLALEILSTHWIDIAIVDLNMPVMDGLTLLEKMRQDETCADTFVVVVSTEACSARIQRVRDLGARFVRKPFSAEELRDTVVELTGVKHELATPVAINDSPDF